MQSTGCERGGVKGHYLVGSGIIMIENDMALLTPLACTGHMKDEIFVTGFASGGLTEVCNGSPAYTVAADAY